MMVVVVLGDDRWLDHPLRTECNSLFRVQVDGDDQTVQTQDFSENEDQDHTDEQSGLLGSTTDTGITDDTDGEAGGQTGESYS